MHEANTKNKANILHKVGFADFVTYQAAKRRIKYPPLATDTDVSRCFGVY